MLFCQPSQRSEVGGFSKLLIKPIYRFIVLFACLLDFRHLVQLSCALMMNGDVIGVRCFVATAGKSDASVCN